jgi:hypothetical protein
LEVLQLDRANGCPWDASTCSGAAEGGHLEVLQWARSNGCPWDSMTCELAAEKGHLEVLQWARSKGCDWDVTIGAVAARGGHLEVLQWVHGNGCDWRIMTFSGDCNDDSYNAVLDWTFDSECGWDVQRILFKQVYRYPRQFESLVWIRNYVDYVYCNPPLEAVAKGRLEVLQWLMLHGGCCWNPVQCLAVAALQRRYAVADWIRDNMNNFPIAT